MSIAMYFQHGHKMNLCVRQLMYSRCWRGGNSRACSSSPDVVLGFLGGTAQQRGLSASACASSAVLEGRWELLSSPLLIQELVLAEVLFPLPQENLGLGESCDCRFLQHWTV